MNRRNKHRARRAPGRVAPALSGLAVLLGVVAVAWAVGTYLLSGGDPEPSGGPIAPTASYSAPAPDPTWPVQTRTPAPPDVVPGDGTFIDPGTVDRADPDAVAEAAAGLYASHDTLLDRSESDARERAAPFLDPSLLELPQAENPLLGEEWLEAQKHEAYSQPLVTPLTDIAAAEHAEEIPAGQIGVPVETASGEPALAYQFDVLYHWQGRDGWVSEPDAGQKREVRLSLVERDGQWVVAEAFYGSPRIVGVK